MIDETKLEQAVEAFLQNPVWADYYGNAPSGAKEIIALEFYSSENDVDDDAEFDELEKECREALEAEDLQYLAEKSPNANERSFYAKMLKDKGGAPQPTGAAGSGETGSTGSGAVLDNSGATGQNGGGETAPTGGTGAVLDKGGETGQTGETTGAPEPTGATGGETGGVATTGATGASLDVTGATGGETGETGKTGVAQ